MEKLSSKDWRFILVCLAVIAVCAGVTSKLFRRAFPEASIEFKVGREGARSIAERFLKEQGRDVSGSRFAGRFDVAETAKVYLERVLGLEGAGRLYGREAKVWLWEMRWFRSGVKEEERVAVSPLGDLVSWESVRKEDAPGARLSQDAARAAALAFLERRGLPASQLEAIEAAPEERPKRTDWKFVDEKRGSRMGEATVRFATTVAGADVASFTEFVHVPEAWTRDYDRLRSKNDAAGRVATVGFVLTGLAMIGVLVTRIVRKDIRWGLVGAFGLAAFVLALLSALNGLPLTLYEYDTSSSLSSYMTLQVLFAFLGALATAAGIAFVVAAAEPIYRERFPRQGSLSGMLSPRGLQSKGFLLAVVLGYALAAFFFAYQAVFYVVAAHFGAWAPAEIPFDNMLNTAFPWATVLLIGFLPAVSEEGISRMFSISFLDRLGLGRVAAVVIPAFIWGFGHSTYPNQPFFIRGLEVGFAGVLIGALMLRFGVLPLLFWHFTVDAIYTALIMLRSGNAYYVASGAIASGILLLPLAISAALAARRGGFLPAQGLSNADAGSAPAPPETPVVAEDVPEVRRVPVRSLALAGVAAAVLVYAFARPSPPLAKISEDRVGRARAIEIAAGFLRANGASPDDYRSVAYEGTGFSDDETAREVKPEDRGKIPGFSDSAARYVLQKGGPRAFRRLAEGQLPLAFWAVRFFQAEKKEEWKVLVDAGRGRVAVFANPREEGAAAGAPPGQERARARAFEAASLLGYPASDYKVLEVGTKARPKRVDTTVVLEASPPGVGEARPRLTAVFQGSLLAAFYPSIHVPEEFLREEQKKSIADNLLLGVKIVGAGALLGLGILVFLRIVRKPEFRWKRLRNPLLLVLPVALLLTLNGLRSQMRGYDTEVPLTLFQLSAAIAVFVGWIGRAGLALVAFVLLDGARPGWRTALRAKGSLWDALLRAGIGAAGFAGLAQWRVLAAARFPALFVPDPSLPPALERFVPGLASLGSAAGATIALAVFAAVLSIAAARPLFRLLPMRAALLLAVVALLVPGDAHSPAEFALEFLPALASAAWMAVVAFVLLRDHAAAWVLFGAIGFGGARVAGMLAQPAAADQAAGWVGVLLIAVTAVLLIAGRRDPRGGDIVRVGEGASGGGGAIS